MEVIYSYYTNAMTYATIFSTPDKPGRFGYLNTIYHSDSQEPHESHLDSIVNIEG
jgi:hypothetical protein